MMGTARSTVVAGTVLLAGVIGAERAMAQEGYDNPTVLAGNAPCITIDEYVLDELPAANGEPTYSAFARLGNICGRTMEVSVCFLLVEETEEAGDRICHAGAIRPWSETTIQTEPAPARIVDREVSWRYYPYQT